MSINQATELTQLSLRQAKRLLAGYRKERVSNFEKPYTTLRI